MGMIGTRDARVRWHESFQFAFCGDEAVVLLEGKAEADARGVVEVVVKHDKDLVRQVDELFWPWGGGSNIEGHSGGIAACVGWYGGEGCVCCQQKEVSNLNF